MFKIIIQSFAKSLHEFYDAGPGSFPDPDRPAAASGVHCTQKKSSAEREWFKLHFDCRTFFLNAELQLFRFMKTEAEMQKLEDSQQRVTL